MNTHAQGVETRMLLVRVEGAATVALPPPASQAVATNEMRMTLPCTIQTGPRSRITLRAGDTVIRAGPDTELEVSNDADATLTLRVNQGRIYILHRDDPARFVVKSPAALAKVLGTDFGILVAYNGTTTYDLFDGELEVSNAAGPPVKLRGRDAAIAEPNQPPRRTPVLELARVVQWNLYYPAIVDADELSLDSATHKTLRESLDAYRDGALLTALDTYPPNRTPASKGEACYLAGLLLATGQTDEAIKALDRSESQSCSGDAKLASVERGLRSLIATVTTATNLPPANPASATEWLARSYTLQSQGDLRAALEAAQATAKLSPQFSFAHARCAELEFSFGNVRAANEAVEQAIILSMRNAQAFSVKGFLLAALGDYHGAQAWFDAATRMDPALGNAWLGRGLCRIHGGDRTEGIADIQVAAAVEPNRSLLRSYLGKAYADSHDHARAVNELDLAKAFDAGDPTPWLYSALLLRQEHRFNEAVTNLEESIRLNDNRALYRSKLRLDEDRAVRSSSLATIYRDAGMPEVSLREATHAVASDYTDYSSHLFMANSYDALRDPTRFNLRYETVWFNELLLANLLAPVGAGTFSQNISQQEYSRMFEQNGLGLNSDSAYRSDGQFRQITSQYGTFDNFGYALDVDYQINDGVRPNNELERLEWYSTFKFQISPQDTVLLLTKYQDYHSGDNFQYYNATNADPDFTFDEQQAPLIVGGYHRQWAPGIHTLALGGRIENDAKVRDLWSNQRLYLTFTNVLPSLYRSDTNLNLSYQSSFVTHLGELCQIFESDRGVLILGGRMQSGDFETTDSFALTNVSLTNLYLSPPGGSTITESFERLSAYGYATRRLFDSLSVTLGFSWDHMKYPSNFRAPPISPGTESRSALNPKAALIWEINDSMRMRGAYARSIGGVSFDESFRLEPTQLAGFVQSFRTVISESEVGSLSAPQIDIGGIALDTKVGSTTYLGVEANWHHSESEGKVGLFSAPRNGAIPPPQRLPTSTVEEIEYDEQSIGLTFNQLLGESWNLGARYIFTRAELDDRLPSIVSTTGAPLADSFKRSDLHRVLLSAGFNHPSGFFARAEADWYYQDNSDFDTSHFIQGNIFTGWRFKRQRGEFGVGILNVGDTDYHLSPLTQYSELPRERVFVTRLKLNF